MIFLYKVLGWRYGSITVVISRPLKQQYISALISFSITFGLAPIAVFVANKTEALQTIKMKMVSWEYADQIHF